MTAYAPWQLADHARSLARAFDVRLIEDSGLPVEASHCVPVERLPEQQRVQILGTPMWKGVVIVRHVTDERTYAICLHEIGHCVAALGSLIHERSAAKGVVQDATLKMMQEEAAYEWAQHYALVWTPTMEAAKQHGLDSYRELQRRAAVAHDAVASRTAVAGVRIIASLGGNR